MTLRIYPPTLDRVLCISENLSESDKLELGLSDPAEITERLEVSRAASFECYVAEIDGKSSVIFGCAVSAADDAGIPWMLCIEGAPLHRPSVQRTCRRFVARWLSLCGRLENLIPRSSYARINWIASLGFHLDVIPGGGHIVFSKELPRV